jgi:NAD(P)-dependent dehydrogenase (short-subunit alcohol dehydrogenase family)
MTVDQSTPSSAGSQKPGIPPIVARMRYTSIIANIKSHLATLGNNSAAAAGRTYEGMRRTGITDDTLPQHLLPTPDDYHSALKVLRYLQLPHIQRFVVRPDPMLETTANVENIEKIMSSVQSQLDRDGDENILRYSTSTKKRERNDKIGPGERRACYICRFWMTSAHPLYPSLCHPCGEFNIASSKISLPGNLNLQNRTAVVTGGRVNLGFHTALRLLRCGASVIVTTRYPQDTRCRYLEEKDFGEWIDRLKIVGADFRSAKDVFDLVAEVKEILKGWGTTKLDILINNAAQTLTDTLEKEQDNIRRESILLENSGAEAGGQFIVAQTQYQPRVRGGLSTQYITSERTQRLVEGTLSDSANQTNSTEISNPHKSSWVQDISEIPYEDVISAHSVNTFVPFILLRELLPLLRRPPHQPTQESQSRPTAYVINVSSREGIPERNIDSKAKAGHHVHTNMSKAGLNMLTETEATKTWKSDKIAINAVDPGYMSADPMWMEMVGRVDQVCPLDWEDGAARALWPIAKGEVDGVAIWGKFLKHFTQIDVNRLS